jgi:hypothetical protein
MRKSDSSEFDDAIRDFWNWFSTNQNDIQFQLDNNNTESLVRDMNARVNAISPILAWEVGPGIVAPYMLVFPTEGDANRRPMIERILGLAPRLAAWEFHTSRPSRRFLREVHLPDKGMKFDTAGWRFELTQEVSSDRLKLDIFDDELSGIDRKIALTAVFILLDAVLGEDVVERWIGDINISSSSGRVGVLPMPLIADRVAELVPH